MAFTETQLIAQADPNGTARTVILQNFIPVGTTLTDVYAVGVIAPYAGRSRWVQVAQSNTPAQAWAVIQAALA
jgi:hypothetical protein